MDMAGKSPSLWRSMALALASRAVTKKTSPAVAPPRTQAPRAAEAADRQDRGKSASTPLEIPARGWKEIAVRVYGEIGEDRVLAVAAGVTFYALLAVFPMIAALVSIYGLVADTGAIGEHLDKLAGVLPGGAVDIIGEQVKRINAQPATSLGLSFFIGLGVSLWSANAGVKAMFDALNVAYGETEKRSFIALNAQSLLFTLGAVVAIIVALAAVVAVPIILRYVWLNPTIELLIRVARWVALLLGVMLALALLYRFGPSREQPHWAWLSPGAILAGLVWIGASMLFSYYAANFGSYNETYGSLGAAIGFMTWIWISATIVLVGAELNSEVENQTDHPSAPGDKQERAADAPKASASRDRKRN